ncbi:MAG: hypothetical protein AAGB14_06815, partial [Verrucomicrobiota bacterium]
LRDTASSGTDARVVQRETSDLAGDAPEIDEMKRIIGTVDPLARAQAWLDYVNTLDPDQFESVVADFRDAGFTRENMNEYGMLLTAWAKADPLSALDYAKENTGTPFARNTILATWVTNDPEGAIAWANQNHEGNEANPFMVGVIRGLAQYDPARASQLMGEMPYSDERGRALSAIMPHILSQGSTAAKNWAESIEDERLRGGAIRRMSEELAKEDPRGTAEWLATTDGDVANGAIDDVMEVWQRQDSSAAIAHFETLPAGELRSNALRGLTNEMASEDPAAAADFLDSHANDADDNTYRQFVWNSMRQEPGLAADYIARIGDEGQRDRMYRRMLEGWMWRDMDGASAWIGSTQLPEGVSQHLERRMQDIIERQQ